jgi:2-methylisocitrate lyase-like PEP mutase family enzyme
MALTQKEKGAAFRALHLGSETFVIPNPWDAGSAKMLAGLGFKALATSSAASACAMGLTDGELSREEALEHAKLIVEATDLPVSADLENGFGDSPEDVAKTIRGAAAAGLVGCSIEDSRHSGAAPVYDFGLAVERIAAAAQVVRSLPFPFLLTARAHTLMHAPISLEETIRRLVAYSEAGADVLFAPGIPDLAGIRAVCEAVSKPVNFMVGIPGKSFTVRELAEAGVRRISLATSLYRAAMTGFLDAAKEVRDAGTFAFLEQCVSTGDLVKLMRS